MNEREVRWVDLENALQIPARMAFRHRATFDGGPHLDMALPHHCCRLVFEASGGSIGLAPLEVLSYCLACTSGTDSPPEVGRLHKFDALLRWEFDELLLEDSPPGERTDSPLLFGTNCTYSEVGRYVPLSDTRIE